MPTPAQSQKLLQVGEIPVTLRRSARRRTLGLQVRGGLATAHAPADMAETRIMAFLQTKRDWLSKHVRAQQAVKSKPLRPGDDLPFLGETLTLDLDPCGTTSPHRSGQRLILPASDWQTHLKQWTRQQVQAPYRQLVQKYAVQLGAEQRLGSVRVSDTRSRWGSCTARGDIRLHWALSRAPLEVLRYVALHEAAHLLELNHSPRYWAHVARIMPDYTRQRAWLREHGKTLLPEAGED